MGSMLLDPIIYDNIPVDISILSMGAEFALVEFMHKYYIIILGGAHR